MMLALLLALLCAIIIVSGFLDPRRIYEFPFLSAAIFGSFVLPQLPGLLDNRFLPEGPVTTTLLFSSLCLAAIWVGWTFGKSRSARDGAAFDEGRLLRGAAVLVAVGSYSFYQFGQLSDEERLRGMLTGTAVAYLFFAKALTYGLVLALLCFARRPSWPAALIIAVASAFYLERIVIAGRRGDGAEFLLVIALAFWFQRRWLAPRLAVISVFALSLVSMIAIGEYRAATYYSGDPDWSAVRRIDVRGNWQRLLDEGGSEMANAAMAIHAVETRNVHTFGANHWNWVVFAFVPAQVVGSTIKRALMLNLPSEFDRGYTPSVGSTSTGMASAFQAFGYFGVVEFLLIGWLLGWFYRAALSGSTLMQIAYMLSVVPGLLAITHFTSEVLIAWVHAIIFLGPVLWLARRNRPAVARGWSSTGSDELNRSSSLLV